MGGVGGAEPKPGFLWCESQMNKRTWGSRGSLGDWTLSSSNRMERSEIKQHFSGLCAKEKVHKMFFFPPSCRPDSSSDPSCNHIPSFTSSTSSLLLVLHQALGSAPPNVGGSPSRENMMSSQTKGGEGGGGGAAAAAAAARTAESASVKLLKMEMRKLKKQHQIFLHILLRNTRANQHSFRRTVVVP